MTQAAARDRILGVLAALAIVLTVVACTAPAASRAAGSAASARAAAPAAPGAISGSSPSPVTMAGAKHCPVTLPRRVGPSGLARQQFFGWGSSFGNGKLWVGGLWPHGVIAASAGFVDRRGRVGMKFGWWRTVPGRLHITGRRLDAPTPPLRADVPAGYGAAGFQPSGVTFPTEGCWEVTGTVHRASLTFVTFVIKKGKTSG